MPFEPVKQAPTWAKACFSPEHSPPNYVCLEPGSVQNWRCPSCGKTTLVIGPVKTHLHFLTEFSDASSLADVPISGAVITPAAH